MNVGVIGAGIAGLAAAWRLRLEGCDVTVYESGARAGGVIKSVSEERFLTEDGPHTLIDRSGPLSDAVGALGLEKVPAASCSARRYVVRGEAPVAVPDGPRSFFNTSLFTRGAKLRILAEPFIPPRRGGEESLANFVRRRFGDEILDYAIDPFVGGIQAGDPERLSARHAFPQVHKMEREHGSILRAAWKRRRNRPASKPLIYSFRSGLSELTDALSFRLHQKILLNARIRRVSRDTCGRWVMDFRHADADDRRVHDAIIVAVPAWALATIPFEAIALPRIARIRTIRYPTVFTLSLGFRRQDIRHPLDAFGVLTPKREGMTLLGALFVSSIFPGRAPDGHALITCFLGGARNPSIAERGNERITEATLEDLRILLGVSSYPVYTRLVRHVHAVPQYEVGYAEHLEAMKNLELDCPGLHLAGAYCAGASIANAFDSGWIAADRALKEAPVRGKSIAAGVHCYQ